MCQCFYRSSDEKIKKSFWKCFPRYRNHTDQNKTDILTWTTHFKYINTVENTVFLYKYEKWRKSEPWCSSLVGKLCHVLLILSPVSLSNDFVMYNCFLKKAPNMSRKNKYYTTKMQHYMSSLQGSNFTQLMSFLRN